MIVTLDGPAGSGKSTLARRLAAHYGWLYLDTGAMYRALALASLDAGIDPGDAESLAELSGSFALRLEPADGGLRVWLGERDVTADIRNPEVTERVSEVSSHPAVRTIIVDQQRVFGGTDHLVAEGRDMGTVVFPGADVKFFLVASLDERARRRHGDYQKKGIEQDFEQVRAAIAERDRLDSSREVAPLVPADDARTVDTTGLTVDEVFDRMAEHIDGVIAGVEPDGA